MPHPSHSTPTWRTYLTPGTLLPRGRFVWWYTLLGLLVLGLGVLGTAWLQHLWEEQDSPWQHAAVLLLALVFMSYLRPSMIVELGNRLWSCF